MHQNGISVDVPEFKFWRPHFEAHSWVWLGQTVPTDPFHFDYQGPGRQDQRSNSIKAFQQLWNRHNPGDKIAVSGQFDSATAKRLSLSPADGF